MLTEEMLQEQHEQDLQRLRGFILFWTSPTSLRERNTVGGLDTWASYQIFLVWSLFFTS